MKKIFFLLLIFISIIACKATKDNINEITLYENDGSQISNSELKMKWNDEIKDYIDNIQIQKLELIEVKDQTTNNKTLTLIGFTQDPNSKVAVELKKFKNGYKLSNTNVLCTSCSSSLNPILNDGVWSCQKDSENQKNCTRTIKTAHNIG